MLNIPTSPDGLHFCLDLGITVLVLVVIAVGLLIYLRSKRPNAQGSHIATIPWPGEMCVIVGTERSYGDIPWRSVEYQSLSAQPLSIVTGGYTDN
jgi:hypothetical protein